jgi:hypothetical protein
MTKTLLDVMAKLYEKNVSFSYYGGRTSLDEPYIEFPRRKEGPRVYVDDYGDFIYEMYSIIKREWVSEEYSFDELIETIFHYEGIAEI